MSYRGADISPKTFFDPDEHYLIDNGSDLGRFSEIDFLPVEDETEDVPVPLERIDHVAQMVAYDELLTLLLFYTSISETRKTPAIPVQTIPATALPP